MGVHYPTRWVRSISNMPDIYNKDWLILLYPSNNIYKLTKTSYDNRTIKVAYDDDDVDGCLNNFYYDVNDSIYQIQGDQLYIKY